MTTGAIIMMIIALTLLCVGLIYALLRLPKEN